MSLRFICSRASLDWVTILFIFLSSPSSFAYTDALAESRFCVATTILLKRLASLSRSFAIVPSSLAITA